MWMNKRIIMIVIIGVSLGIANAQGMDSSDTELTKSTLQAGYQFEGELIFHQDLSIGIIAGTSEHSKLVEVKSIRFESTYGNAWGVTARVGWLPVIDATWKLKVELLDEKGRMLRNSRDEAVIFTGKAAKMGRTTIQYVDLDMDPMQDQGRRHAVRFRVCLESVEEQFDVTKTADMKTHTVEVVVVQQANKKPVPYASLILSSLYIRDSYRREQTLYTTDSQGRCQIRLNAEKLYSLSISAQKQGFATMFKSFSNYGSSDVGRLPLVNLPNSHTFEMLSASPVGGIVRDKEGNMIEGAEVRFEAYLDDPSGRISIRRSVRTDANGQWRVEGVPSEVDRISIGLKHPEYGGDHGTNRYMTGEALLNARALKHVETLDKGITVTGQVLDGQGQPIAGATAMLAQRNSMPFFAITDPTGSFRFVCSGDRDTYGDVPTVVVEAPGYAPALKAIDIEPDPEPLEFRLTRGKTIKCRVVDSEGKPIADAWTVVQPLLPDYRDYDVWLEDTDQQGEFEIPNVPDSDINLTVGKQGYITIRDYVLVPSEDEFTIPMKRALTLTGTVTDAQTGKPIPNFEIATVYSTGGRTRTGNPVAFVEGTYELSIDEARPESRQLQITAVGYESTVSEEIKIDEGRRVINFPLARASDFDEKTAGRPRKQVSPPGVRRITGLVRDEKGVPVSDAVISTRPSLGAETTTNADGTFTFRTRRTSMTGSSSREETTYLLIRHKERNLAAAIELDDDAETLDVKLTPGVIMSGKVVDIKGRGIPDAKLSMTFWVSDWGYGSWEVAHIDAQGNYEIRAVPSGHRYSVTASADGYGQRYVQAHTSEAVGNLMELEPLVLFAANLSASGIVVDEFDKPVHNIRIYAYGNGQPTRETYTDAEGKFTLENICEGPISIQANKTDMERLHGRAKAEGGATDIKIVVSQYDAKGKRIPKQHPSLVGKPLPDIKSIISDFAPEQAKGQIVLVCFFDMQQRPSRNCLIRLAKQANQLKQKGVTVVTVQASKIDEDTLNDWVKKNNIPFPIGMVQGDVEKSRFAWGVRSLPWLILTDHKHIIRSNGFSLAELNEKIPSVKNSRRR